MGDRDRLAHLPRRRLPCLRVSPATPGTRHDQGTRRISLLGAWPAGTGPHTLEGIPGYTGNVKTAISLPDDTYEQASRRAAELGISRSEFFARAARRYLDELASHSITQQINEALQAAADDSSAAAATAGRRYLAAQDDSW
jgi:Ribbon-helix-helix protein, copG family